MEFDRVGTHVGSQVSESSVGSNRYRAGRSARGVLKIAAVAGALAVLIGAFGAHGLPGWLESAGVDAETLPRRLAQFDTGARYHLAHAIGLLALAALPVAPTRVWKWCVGLFTAGIILFSGSLYFLVLTNTPWLGAITPIGGVCWVVAWLLLLWMTWLGDE